MEEVSGWHIMDNLRFVLFLSFFHLHPYLRRFFTENLFTLVLFTFCVPQAKTMNVMNELFVSYMSKPHEKAIDDAYLEM